MASLHNKRTLVKTPWLFCMTFYLTNMFSSNYFLIDYFSVSKAEAMSRSPGFLAPSVISGL